VRNRNGLREQVRRQAAADVKAFVDLISAIPEHGFGAAMALVNDFHRPRT